MKRRKSKFKLNEKLIQEILYTYFQKKFHILAIPNFYYNSKYESDLISITKTKLVHEFEIKCNISDFKKDFQKKKWKHKDMNEKIKVYMKANYFWFVCPENLIDINDIPDYAGFIEITKNYNANIIKNAPRLHGDKIDNWWLIKIGRGLMYRYWKIRGCKIV